MSVYWTVHYDVTDPDTFAKYWPGSLGTISAVLERHGGELQGSAVGVPSLAGPSFAVNLVFRFGSADAVEGFLNDPDYAEARALRLRATTNLHSVVVPASPTN